MPRCSICSHPKRAEIDKALISGMSLRNVSERFGTSGTTLHRHKNAHLAKQIERAERQIESQTERAVIAQEERRDAEALDVHTELRRIFLRLNKMADACDAWLTDPDNPDVYDLNPRAHEVKVTYEVEIGEDRNGNPIMKRKKDDLATLIRMIEQGGIGNVTMVESKIGDPRQLIINTANALKPSVELLAKLVGKIDDAPKVQIQINAIEIAR